VHARRDAHFWCYPGRAAEPLSTHIPRDSRAGTGPMPSRAARF